VHSTACHRQKRQTKHNSHQAAQNQPTEAHTHKEKKTTLKLPYLEMHSLKKNKLNMNFRKSARRWMCRPKDL